ncbi:MAG: DUF6364 family protein [Bacteroidota bacterium]
MSYKKIKMDSKVTLSFDEEVIESAKKFAKSQNISLSRLTEFLYRQISSNNYQSLEELPISDWVNSVAEGKVEYKTKARKSIKKEYYEGRK